MKKILFAATLVFLCGTLAAQNTISQYGTSLYGLNDENYDENGNLIDSTAVIDANTIPIGLDSWTIDERFGDMTPTPVDTLMHGFQNSNDTGGPTGHYTYLGNLGAPRISHVFFERKDPSQFFFTDPYDYTVRKPGDVVYTNTKSPFSNLTYYKQGSGHYAEERFKAYFAVNVNKRMGFGFDIDYTYGRGKYDSQSTALFNGNLFAYYHGDHYEMHSSVIFENLKMAENGGITDDRYVTAPLEMAEGGRTYETYNMPTNLTDIWNNNRGYHIFLTHRYNLGFYRTVSEETDTIVRQVFVPVTSFFHTMKVDVNRRKYVSYDTDQNEEYFEHNYLGTDSTDITRNFSIKNTVGITLREGFNKWAKAGLTAFASFEHRHFTLTDTVAGGGRIATPHNESTFSIGGQLSKQQGRTFHYNVVGEVAMFGEDAGQFTLEGNGDLNFHLRKDTVRFEVNAYIKNLNPTFYFRHFHSKHYWWDNDLSKMMRTRIEGELSIDRWRTRLKAGVENIKNYTYLDNASVSYTDDDGEISYKNDMVVRQHSGNIQVFSATLRQDFKLGILHLDNEVTYQKSSDEDILPLPDLVLYHDLYLRFTLVKVLRMEIGADMRYFTRYYAPDYAPAIGQFYLQNTETRYKLGGYPMINGYLNIHLKRTRFFVMMYNILQGEGERSYIYVPHYPLNPRLLKFGISWYFFD